MRIFSLYILLLFLFFQGCVEKNIKTFNGNNIAINDEIKIDSSILNFYTPYKNKLQEGLMNKPISYSMETYKKNDGVLNSSLGNMFADATFELINPIFNDKTGNALDVVILNNGGIRSIISEGPVSEKTAFELMPFENSIVVVKLKGKSINRMIDYLAKVKLPHPMKGLEIVLSKKYEIKSVLLRNNPIDENKYYFVATTDYLLDGGDKMYFLAESVETTYLDYKMRDVLIDYFIKTDTLKLKTDNRFIIN